MFVSIDLTPALTKNRAKETMDVAVLPYDPTARIWAMLTITDNETQQVTIISPQ